MTKQMQITTIKPISRGRFGFYPHIHTPYYYYYIRRLIIYTCLCIFLASGCAPNPIDVAEGYQIQTEADTKAAQAAADLEAQIRADKEAYQIEHANQADKITQQKAMTYTVTGLTITLLCVLCFFTARAISIVLPGFARAAVQAAEIRSLLIRMDNQTRSFPLLVMYKGKGLFSMTNTNTGETMLLDSRHPADTRLINMFTKLQMVDIVASKQENAFTIEGTEIDPNIVILGDQYNDTDQTQPT